MRTIIRVTTFSALLAASAVMGSALAKAPAAPPAAPSASPPPAAFPIPPPPPRVAQDANGNPMPPPVATTSGSTQVASVPSAAPFATLDRSGTGIVTREQASGDPWLSANFARCDADHNNEVSQGEYQACSSQMK
jgi:hypothetical protein